MSDLTLIPVVCISKSGEPVTFHVRSIVSIDGRPLQPDQNDMIAAILTRLDAVEAAITTLEGEHA